MPPVKRKGNGHRWRQLTKRVYTEENVCGLCGYEVDKTLSFVDPNTSKPNPLAKSIDHIIPLSQGGNEYERSNCQLAHRRCNRDKSDGTQAPKMRPTSTLKRVRAY